MGFQGFGPTKFDGISASDLAYEGSDDKATRPNDAYVAAKISNY